jgi:Ser/Thr protein kinase RdoA (MazF antagonist)
MGGKGIGKFQAQLADFTEPLAEVIKGFHNIRWRFQQWDEALAADKAGRKAELATEIEWIESRREKMLDFWKMVEDGRLPLRVTHNDTKLSNILFDQNDEVLCVIDLDTVMSSTALNDFGDAICSYTNTGAEDDEDLSRVSMNIDTFKHYTAGYLSERCASMTDTEKEWLAFSALYITYEQVLRFLMDYIDGDTYYKTRYPKHNLVRTHAQYKLLTSMEEQYSEMQKIVKELAK